MHPSIFLRLCLSILYLTPSSIAFTSSTNVGPSSTLAAAAHLHDSSRNLKNPPKHTSSEISASVTSKPYPKNPWPTGSGPSMTRWPCIGQMTPMCDEHCCRSHPLAGTCGRAKQKPTPYQDFCWNEAPMHCDESRCKTNFKPEDAPICSSLCAPLRAWMSFKWHGGPLPSIEIGITTPKIDF
jgi:hypothetical protein